MLSGATFYDCINTIYQFIKPFLDNKMSIFEEYRVFKKQMHKKKKIGHKKVRNKVFEILGHLQ